MVRLITLKLQPVLRPVNHPHLPPTHYSPPPIPTKSPRRTESKMSSALPLPQTQNQWRIVLDEVRGAYLRRQHKQCSVRCIQLLETAPNTVSSLHCIYLSLYAAICLELLAQPLSIQCSEKLALFNLARVYYEKTEQYMREAESGLVVTSSNSAGSTCLEIYHHFSSASSNSSYGSRRSSTSSAIDSPDSYTSLSPMHSPASSVCSSFSKSEDESCGLLKPRPLRVRKTVSFQLSPPTGVSSAENNYTRNCRRASSIFQSRLDKCLSQATGCTPTTPPVNTIASDTVSSLHISPSLDRCVIHLTTLRIQLKHHLVTISELISFIQSTQQSPSAYKPDPKGRRSKRGNLPTMFDSYKTMLPDIIKSEAEEKARQRAVRIAQLKQRGVDWKLGKGRFDGSKYERLCQEALKELG